MKMTLVMYLHQSIVLLYQTHKHIGQGSGWIIDSVIDYNINVSKYNTLAGSSHIKLPKELDHPRKCMINVQNIVDKECFKWCLVRSVHPADVNPSRIKKADIHFKRFDFKSIFL